MEMLVHKATLLAAVIQEFELKCVAYIGSDETFNDVLLELLGDYELQGLPEDEEGRPIPASADAVYVDEWGNDPLKAIDTAMQLIRPGAFLFGSEYLHSNLPVMSAVEERFNLMRVQVGPAGTWCTQREVELKEVA